MIYVTSDHHFFHEKIISMCPRFRSQWANVDEMNAGLVNAWNSVVNDDDTVWHLGDLAFHKKGDVGAVLGKLAGQKHLVVGNHDAPAVTKLDGWAGVHRDTVWLDAGWNFIPLGPLRRSTTPAVLMDHYLSELMPPQMKLDFPGAARLHGHSHGKSAPYPMTLDVGVDAVGPVPLRMDDAVKMARAVVGRVRSFRH